MRRPKTSASKIVATFGAGMACAYLAPSAEGAIITLTPTPESVAFFPGTSAFSHPIQLFTGVSFGQYNDNIGKTFLAGAGLSGFQFAPYSNAITTGQAVQGGFAVYPGQAGALTFGFRTTLNQVGWIQIDFGGSGGPVTYLAAAYNNTPGGSIHSGSTEAVPEPTSLALLALASLAAGARGVRRLRERRKT